jgi:hypothetical protein
VTAAALAACALAAGFAQDVCPCATASASAAAVAGVWRGQWHDDVHGHRGPLKARVVPQGDGTYRATFTGRFAALVPFRFGTTLTPQPAAGGGAAFAGSQSLGPFGSFDYAGVADAAAFHADYSARRWRGRFEMTRVR